MHNSQMVEETTRERKSLPHAPVFIFSTLPSIPLAFVHLAHPRTCASLATAASLSLPNLAATFINMVYAGYAPAKLPTELTPLQKALKAVVEMQTCVLICIK